MGVYFLVITSPFLKTNVLRVFFAELGNINCFKQIFWIKYLKAVKICLFLKIPGMCVIIKNYIHLDNRGIVKNKLKIMRVLYRKQG